MSQLSPGQTLQPMALVREAWLRLAGESGQARRWKSRGHFFAAAAEAMLGVPERTAERAWAYARAWLYREIQRKL